MLHRLTSIGAIATMTMLLASCSPLEQAEPLGPLLNVGIRHFGPLFGTGMVNEGYCEARETSFHVLATLPDGEDADLIDDAVVVADPVAFEIFQPFSEQSDADNPPPPVLVVPGGCIFTRAIVMPESGQWTITAWRDGDGPNGGTSWVATCQVVLSLDESFSNVLFVGFSENGLEYPVVDSLSGCAYDPTSISLSFP